MEDEKIYITKGDAVLALLEKGQHSKRYKLGETWELNFFEIQEAIDDMPAADVQPVKRGAWRKDEQGYDVYVECSECGLNLSTSNYIENEWRDILKYCPCCGARMDGDTE